MKKATKVWLITAASLVLIGSIFFAGVMSILGWDFTKLETVKCETSTYEINAAFDSIFLDTGTADIVFAMSDDGKCKVACYEKENATHLVTVEENTLIVKLVDERSASIIMGYIGINFSSPKITVYLPESEYASLTIREDTGDIKIPDSIIFRAVDISTHTGDVDFCASATDQIKIKTSTGYIRVESISAGSLDLSVSTGKVTVSDVTCASDVTVGVSTGKAYLSDIRCKNVISKGSTGDFSLINVIASERFFIKRSTGDIRFDGSDAAEIYAETDTGNITGTLLTNKVFITQTVTGKIHIPKTAAGGKCEISTNIGDIIITID